MISREELLKQKTKRDTNIEKLEKIIDNNLRKVYPDCIKDEEIKFERVSLDGDYDEEIIEEVLNKYIKQGGIFYMYVDIILKL